jgi:beta-lactamase superfamily II metal-dependent hydrolase
VWRGRSSAALVAAFLCVAGVAAQAQRPGTDSLRVIFFDVGQGDAALIITPDKKHILIDAGPGGAGIAARLRALGVQTLDLVVASHNHADHIGGMPDVFGATQVLEYMDNGVPALTRAYRRLVDAVTSEPGLRVRQPTAREFRAGRTTLRVMAPSFSDESQNDNSIGILVQYGEFSALFTGDAQRGELLYWLLSYRILPVSVLKASHHGSWNGVSEGWVTKVAPKAVVVSVGANNQYGHPDQRVLDAWTSMKASVYRTDSLGTITISASDSGGFTVRSSRDTTQVPP